MSIQCMVHYDNEPCLVDLDADAYFDLQGDDLFEISPVIPEDAQLPFLAESVETQMADPPVDG